MAAGHDPYAVSATFSSVRTYWAGSSFQSRRMISTASARRGLIPLHPLRQIGDDDEVAVLKANGPGGFAAGGAGSAGASAVLEIKGAVEPVFLARDSIHLFLKIFEEQCDLLDR